MIFPRCEPLAVWQKFITSGKVETAGLGFSDATALLAFAQKSTVVTGFFVTIEANILSALAECLRKVFKIFPKPSASLVVSSIVIDIFLLQLAPLPINNSRPVLAGSPYRLFVLD